MHPVHILAPSLTPPPSSPGAGCTPGEGGIPSGAWGSVACGTWAFDLPHDLWGWATVYWPLLTGVVVALIAARIGWAIWRRHRWQLHADRARWLEIVPPVTATPAATLALWKLLASLLSAPRRLAVRPPRLVWEVRATPTGMRCGLWVPPGVNPSAVVRVLQRGWPGARVEQVEPPRLPQDAPTAGLDLVPMRSEFYPIVDEPRPSRASWRPGAPSDEDDRLRAVFDGLAAAGRTGGGLLQVHVSRAPRHRVAALRRAMINPSRARRPRTATSRTLGLVADGLRTLLIALLDIITPGPARKPASRSQTEDPFAAELADQARVKYATAPHLLIAVRATATGPTRGAARAAAADITSGYGLLSPYFGRRRLRRPLTAAGCRWVPANRMTLATVAEVAALAGLPAEPATFGMPAAAARHRLVTGDTWRPARTTHPASAPPTRRRPASAVPPLRRPGSPPNPPVPPASAMVDTVEDHAGAIEMFTFEEGDDS